MGLLCVNERPKIRILLDQTIVNMETSPSSGKKEKKQNLGVARKLRGSGYPTEEQLSRYRRRIRVELVKDRQDAFGRNFWGKMDETKRIFCVSG